MTVSVAAEKLKKYCAYQERSHMEVVDKLYKLGLYKNEVDQVVLELLQQNFLNEERFAKAFASGKFRIKKWGRVKIKSHLKQKRISDFCIKKGLAEIDEDEYVETLTYWIDRKKEDVKEKDEFKKNGKIAAFLIQKGFESGLVWEALRGD
ncbi:MAG: regulatory protein RecX [Flavobacteriales bacterium]